MTTQAQHFPQDPARRVVIDGVSPHVDGGLFPVKRTVNDAVCVEADVVSDGHDLLGVVLQYRRHNDPTWNELPMEALGNDRYTATFWPEKPGIYHYNVCAWIDHLATWHSGLKKKFQAGDSIELELRIGAELLDAAARRAEGMDAELLRSFAQALRDDSKPAAERFDLSNGKTLSDLSHAYPDRRHQARWERDLPVLVERERAAFGAWYEFFPRSWGARPGTHGTFREAAQRVLPEVARMGFHIVYLPPIHPIGQTHRKGKNNALTARPDDVGSPWAIGSKEGGHKDIHPQLGTLADFRAFVARAGELGLEIALDIAFQCSPDHPYVKEHPQWFKWRPDGTVQYAENPPKKYQDILPFHFECDDAQALWEELKSVFEFWIQQGVKIFRVDNPHTKPLEFWRWLIWEIKQQHPDVIFLAEAFTRPRIKYRLAKAGFTQGYTYFTWRNTRDELTTYLKELTAEPVKEYFWPNFWPNTPDILHEYLQFGGRPAHAIRLVLAAMFCPNYGIYGPAFELCDSEAFPGKEEYNHNEKYEIKQWDWETPGNLKDFIARINRIRRDNPALQRLRNLLFVETDNPQVIAFIKHTPDFLNIVLTIVNLDFHNPQQGWVTMPLERLRMAPDSHYLVQDMLAAKDDMMPKTNYLWQGARNYFSLNPAESPAHIFRVFRKVRRENEFDYWL